MSEIEKCCDNCDNLIAIGEGDFICYECGEKAILPISGYAPTDKYLQCGGNKFSE